MNWPVLYSKKSLELFMAKNTILFDIDRTIFDTKKFKEHTIAHYEKLLDPKKANISGLIKEYDATLPSRDYYHPNDLASYIAKRLGHDEKGLQEKFWDATHIFENSLFEDTIHVLENLSKTHRLGIFSQGIEDYQLAKLLHGKIHHHFEKEIIFISRNKAHPDFLSKIPKGVMIVDDKPEMIEKISINHKPIWINRESKERHPIHPTIHNLNELAKVLANSK